MTRRQFVGAIVFASLAYGAFLAGGIFFPGARVLAADKPAGTAPDWSPKAAAKYSDSRDVWWKGWDRAHKDHGTL
ncbi:MAG: hypothetical protein WA354_21585, partial [Terracidiphilus sp.]